MTETVDGKERVRGRRPCRFAADTLSSFYKGHSKSLTSCVPNFLPDLSLVGPLGCPLTYKCPCLAEVKIW